MSDILERLRMYKVLGPLSSLAIHPETPGFSTGRVLGDTCEAANTIVALRAELANWKRVCKDMCDDCDTECPPECDDYGHAENCGQYSVAQSLKNCRADLAAAKKDAAECRALLKRVNDSEFELDGVLVLEIAAAMKESP